ncbi:aminotransferase class V-fold PLP-dependent enzyme [Methylobacterium oryzihabitans]|uniref:Cysteine desulfurase n=1 Tax=Methylobacterium oryzihabitans TaxID=2499852 RepID=A0A3S2YSJ7_9HYPH|nr:aminotransferase class V-fold PLP-dependent enzyme [Methylobacterium oryzihabitans]RVU18488.1 aminotransferase class V-fold PLP-dependent enzyme [Methylobacterium oryzihabitans]
MPIPRPTYLDCAATTAVDTRVADLVLRLFTEEFGNAGSRTHVFGLEAHRAVGEARERIAKALACSTDEVVFTSGATESDNLAILGLSAWGIETGRRHVVTTAIEHKAVLEPLAYLASQGFEVTHVQPDRQGYVTASDVLAAVRPDTMLVSVMHANNETGALQPITAIADGLSDGGPFLHVDAAQTFGRKTLDLHHRRIDLVSLSAHKVFGPKGVGALIARRRGGSRPRLRPLQFGGGQERGLRPGTQPVPLIAGFGLAAELAERECQNRAAICQRIRNEALAALATLQPIIHGDERRGVLPNILSVALPGLDSEAVMVALKGVAAISNGSACTSSSYEPSHVLAAMELPDDVIAGTVRMSWSHHTPPVDWPGITRILDDLRL